MADVNDLENTYTQTVWEKYQWWAAWPPIISNLDLGTYGYVDDWFFNIEGNIGGSFGCADLIKPTAVAEPLPHATVDSDQLSRAYYTLDQDGKATVPIDEIQLQASGTTEVKFATSSDISYFCAYDSLTRSAIGPAVGDATDVAGYLQQQVWPRLQAAKDPAWNQHKYVVVGEVIRALSYAFAGGVQNTTEFGFAMDRGIDIEALVSGAISGSVNVDEINSVELADAAYDLPSPGIVGFTLWHFEGDYVRNYKPFS